MRIRGYMATTIDGYIADRDGGFGFLAPYDSVDAGYPQFIAEISTVVLGRVTYDQLAALGTGWPYAGKRAIVVSRRPLSDPPPSVERWTGDVPALIAHLRAADGDAWVVGGAALQSAFLEAGAIDVLDMFIVPVLLGDGIRMFPQMAVSETLRLDAAHSLGKGMVRLSYRRL